MPTCWIISGPNGAGKTTFALEYPSNVAGCTNFVNADFIAAGLSTLAPERELLTASLNNLLLLFSEVVDHCICFMNDSENPIL